MFKASGQELWHDIPDGDRSRLPRKSSCDRNHDEDSGSDVVDCLRRQCAGPQDAAALRERDHLIRYPQAKNPPCDSRPPARPPHPTDATVVVLLGFVYVEDVRHGIGVLSAQVVDWILPDLML